MEPPAEDDALRAAVDRPEATLERAEEPDAAAELMAEPPEEAALEAEPAASVALPAASLEKIVVLPMVLVMVEPSVVMVVTIAEVVIAPA